MNSILLTIKSNIEFSIVEFFSNIEFSIFSIHLTKNFKAGLYMFSLKSTFLPFHLSQGVSIARCIWTESYFAWCNWGMFANSSWKVQLKWLVIDSACVDVHLDKNNCRSSLQSCVLICLRSRNLICFLVSMGRGISSEQTTVKWSDGK